MLRNGKGYHGEHPENLKYLGPGSLPLPTASRSPLPGSRLQVSANSSISTAMRNYETMPNRNADDVEVTATEIDMPTAHCTISRLKRENQQLRDRSTSLEAVQEAERKSFKAIRSELESRLEDAEADMKRHDKELRELRVKAATEVKSLKRSLEEAHDVGREVRENLRKSLGPAILQLITLESNLAPLGEEAQQPAHRNRFRRPLQDNDGKSHRNLANQASTSISDNDSSHSLPPSTIIPVEVEPFVRHDAIESGNISLSVEILDTLPASSYLTVTTSARRPRNSICTPAKQGTLSRQQYTAKHRDRCYAQTPARLIQRDDSLQLEKRVAEDSGTISVASKRRKTGGSHDNSSKSADSTNITRQQDPRETRFVARFEPLSKSLRP